MQKTEKSAIIPGAGLVLALLMVPAALAQAVDWNVGDVFAGTGNGSYQAFHNGSLLGQALSEIPPAGQTAGCAFDSAYRLFGTDFDNTQIVRFAIDNLSDVTLPIAINLPANPTVAQQIAGGTTCINGVDCKTAGAVGPSKYKKSESVAFDATGNFYVGYAGTSAKNAVGDAGVEIYNHDGVLQNFFSPSVDQMGVDWLDVTGGSTIVYTSEGTKIFILDTSNVASGSSPKAIQYTDLSTDFGGKFKGKLFQIRALPANGNLAPNGVLVANQGSVVWVQSDCHLADINTPCTALNAVAFTKFPAQETHLQFVSLDPNNPLGFNKGLVSSGKFWAADASTSDVMQYDVAKNKVVSTFTAGGTLGGICAHGSFSPAQPAPSLASVASGSTNLTPAANTVTFNLKNGGTLTASLNFAPNTPSATVTLRETLVDPSTGQSDPIVYALNTDTPIYIAQFCAANPGSPLCPAPPPPPADCSQPGCTVPGSIICDQTFTPGLCEVLEFEAVPNSGFSTNFLFNPPAAPPQISNLRFLRNEDEDVTDLTDGLGGTKTSGSRSCVYTFNRQNFAGGFNNPQWTVCGGGFSSPANGASFSKNQTSSIAFKFKVSPSSSSTCDANSGPTNLMPLMLIVQNQPSPPKGPTPAPIPQQVLVAGGSNQTIVPPIFTLSGNTWQIQVKTSDLAAGFSYTATMIDLTGQVPAISVNFNLK